jgi:hypothetical protein
LSKEAFDGGVVKAQGDEAAVFVEGVAEAEGLAFEVRPVGAEGVGGHAEEEDAGVFEALFDLGGDVVAGADFPIVEPDAEAVGAEAFGEGRTVAMSLELWLRKTSCVKSSAMFHLSRLGQERLCLQVSQARPFSRS